VTERDHKSEGERARVTERENIIVDALCNKFEQVHPCMVVVDVDGLAVVFPYDVYPEQLGTSSPLLFSSLSLLLWNARHHNTRL
jgi:hypothetical protein